MRMLEYSNLKKCKQDDISTGVIERTKVFNGIANKLKLLKNDLD